MESTECATELTHREGPEQQHGWPQVGRCKDRSIPLESVRPRIQDLSIQCSTCIVYLYFKIHLNLPEDSTLPLHGTLIPSAQRLAWAAKQPLGNAALGALFA